MLSYTKEKKKKKKFVSNIYIWHDTIAQVQKWYRTVLSSLTIIVELCKQLTIKWYNQHNLSTLQVSTS